MLIDEIWKKNWQIATATRKFNAYLLLMYNH